MRETIKIDFADFWPDFVKTDNYFHNLLARRYDVVVTDDPDFLIFSGYGRTFRRYRCVRIFYTGENRAADFSECDFAITHDYIDHPDHFRLPHWVVRHPRIAFDKPAVDPAAILRSKSGFCSFVVSNPVGRTRNRFFEKLSRYKQVDSGGRYLNNVGGPVADKFEFTGRYKFNIAFENSSFPGYTTEKLFDPLLVHSVPIYWGDPEVARDFDPACFVSYRDPADEDRTIERVIALDRDDDAYMKMLAAPWFAGGRPPEFVEPDWQLDHFHRFFHESRKPVAMAMPTPAQLGRRLSSWWARRNRRKHRVR